MSIGSLVAFVALQASVLRPIPSRSIRLASAASCGSSTSRTGNPAPRRPQSTRSTSWSTPVRRSRSSGRASCCTPPSPTTSRFAKPDAIADELWHALEVPSIDDLIAGLPDGLDAVVGARGQRFSGGEQQRPEIARTVLRDPRILVLDEATSALDNSTVREVQQALEALAVGRTTVLIAHRLSTVSTVRDADQLVVLDHGRTLERGIHTELLEADGADARLVGTEERVRVLASWRGSR